MFKNFQEMQDSFFRELGADKAFDFKKRKLQIGGRKALLVYVIGFTNAYLMRNILSSVMAISKDKVDNARDISELMEKEIPFAEAEVAPNIKKAAEEVLRGSSALLIDGFENILIFDARMFLLRGPEEPENDRTLRGPHIGLNESMISNLVQIRRFLRTGELESSRFFIGSKAKTEVTVLSVRGRADPKIIKVIEKKLKNAQSPTLSMTQESLAAILFPQKGLSVLNPFPRVRYTERPDVIAATLMEGKIAILCDNSPSAILLPESVFDFFEEADDYYFPPVTASYLRIVRAFIFLASIFTIPIWLLLVSMENTLPDTFSFILTEGEYSVPLFLQFLIIEIAMDGLKMASLNTPGTLSGSFSVIGGLLLGEYAVKSGWFVPQTILYSAFSAIANFVPTNYELGYSFKFIRMSLILLVEFFGLWGLVAGTILWVLILASTKSLGEKGYLYPFLPFHGKGVFKILFRTRKGREREL